MSTIRDDTDPYDRDFVAWTAAQARLLRRQAERRPNTPLDLDHLALEIESLGRSDRRALLGHVTRVLEHLVKLEHAPAEDPRAGWEDSVRLHREDARAILADSRSLASEIAPDLDRCWHSAIELALPARARDGVRPEMPASCPVTAEQVLDDDWWPGGTA
jgi:hypothetical protein